MDAIDKHNNEKPGEGEARPVTYEMLVEMLDPKDYFGSKLFEILVKVSLSLSSFFGIAELTEICSGYLVANRNSGNATLAGRPLIASCISPAELRTLSTSSRVPPIYTQTPNLVQLLHSGADGPGTT
jgi:hypothetical protein